MINNTSFFYKLYSIIEGTLINLILGDKIRIDSYITSLQTLLTQTLKNEKNEFRKP